MAYPYVERYRNWTCEVLVIDESYRAIAERDGTMLSVKDIYDSRGEAFRAIYNLIDETESKRRDEEFREAVSDAIEHLMRQPVMTLESAAHLGRLRTAINAYKEP